MDALDAYYPERFALLRLAAAGDGARVQNLRERLDFPKVEAAPSAPLSCHRAGRSVISSPGARGQRVPIARCSMARSATTTAAATSWAAMPRDRYTVISSAARRPGAVPPITEPISARA
jgi:hypothetical protein